MSHVLAGAFVLLAACVAAGIALGPWYAAKHRAAAVPVAAGLALVAAVGTLGIVRAYARNVTQLAQWDFLCFWLYGHALARHLDPYGADALRQVPLPQPVDAEFARDVLAVGIPYPPWSLALFRPLGWFADPHVGAAFWCTVLFAALVGSVLVLARWEKPVSRPRALAAAALVVVLPPSLATAHLAQTTPLVLLCLALYLTRMERRDAGIWLALAIAVKPFALLLVVVPLLRRRWSDVGVVAAVLVALTLAGVAIAGPDVVVDYVRENPIARTSGAVLTEANNVPVAAYVLRATHVEPPNAAALPAPLVALDVVLLLVGVGGAAVAARHDPVVAACGLLALALLLYPQSNVHYAQLLALPLLALRRSALLSSRPMVVAALFGLTVALLTLAGGADTMFASLLVWLASLGVGFRIARSVGASGDGAHGILPVPSLRSS